MKKLIFALFMLSLVSCDDGIDVIDKHVYVRKIGNIWIHDPNCPRCTELKITNDSIYDAERANNY